MVLATKFDNSKQSRFLLVLSKLRDLRQSKAISLSAVARITKRQVSQIHGIETPQPTEANLKLLEEYLVAVGETPKDVVKCMKYIESGK